jgi:hypothetical protein
MFFADSFVPIAERTRRWVIEYNAIAGHPGAKEVWERTLLTSIQRRFDRCCHR